METSQLPKSEKHKHRGDIADALNDIMSIPTKQFCHIRYHLLVSRTVYNSITNFYAGKLIETQ